MLHALTQHAGLLEANEYKCPVEVKQCPSPHLSSSSITQGSMVRQRHKSHRIKRCRSAPECDTLGIQDLLRGACQPPCEIAPGCGVYEVARLAKRGRFSCVRIVTIGLPNLPIMYSVTNPGVMTGIAILSGETLFTERLHVNVSSGKHDHLAAIGHSTFVFQNDPIKARNLTFIQEFSISLRHRNCTPTVLP